MRHLKLSAGLFALAMAAASCSGGDSAAPDPVAPAPAPPAPVTPPPPPPPPPAMATTVASGTVTGFSSIVVNGVTIETDGDTVFSVEGEDDVTGDDSAIALGLVVAAVATENANGMLMGNAFSVDDGNLGVVESISPDPDNPEFGTFLIAGQTIIVDGNTIFDDDIPDADGIAGVDLRDLDPAVSPGGLGLVVEVSGFPTEFGAIASRIDLEDDFDATNIGTPGVEDDEVQVVGFVDSVDVVGNTFSINGATFLVDGETDLDDGLVLDDTLIGAFVEVEADIDPAGGFIAVEVENEGDDFDDLFDDDADDEEIDIEGLLQSVDLDADPDLIVINGLEIPVTDASGLVPFVGQIVDIEGTLNADGVLVLSEIEIEQENSVETEDLIESIDVSAGTFTTRLGLEIEPTVASRLEIENDLLDDDNLTPDEFLGALSVGDFVEARGVPGPDGVLWTRIEVEGDEDDQECSLQGPVEADSIADPIFSILGVTIDTTGLEDDSFEGEDDSVTGRAAFFEALMAGDIIEAESDEDGLGCSAGLLQTFSDGEVSFEDDDNIAGNARPLGIDGIDTLEVSGPVAALNPIANTFIINGFLVTVTDETLIDDSIVEAARQQELDSDDDFTFGELPETLDELLQNGDQVEVTIDADGNAIEIEADD